ncbi:putative THIF-type NAD/FAD binding, ubiquitin-activating enzyme E1, FCCH domain-containing protein [Helianthus annuus]|nr:putative THIF-type NAD/FAD binding, ubiquitin-activating enzyme E1, FCCH domain-containing protein [Helianthus annuus]
MGLEDVNMQEIDEDLHSRQLAVYGRETMRRLFASNVLISGMQGLGAEIASLQTILFKRFADGACSAIRTLSVAVAVIFLPFLLEYRIQQTGYGQSCFFFRNSFIILNISCSKNLILAGVKSVTLHDEGLVELWDLSSNFIFSENDVGKNRALASAQKLQELNNAVLVSTLSTKLTKEQLSNFQEPHTGIIASISNDKPALVTCVDDERLEFQDGDLVIFSEIHGMTELNDGKPRKVKAADHTRSFLKKILPTSARM